MTIYTTLRGPFRLTDQVDALNQLLEELREEQRTCSATYATAGGQGEPYASSGHCVHVSSRLPDRPLANDPEQVMVHRPSRVQWLLSHDEEEMAEVVDEMITASTQRKQMQTQIQEQQQDNTEEPP